MATKGVAARRYAETLFELGREQNTIDQWISDLAFLSELLSNHKLLVVLTDPRLALATKKDIVSDLTQGKVNASAFGLAMVLVEQNALDLMTRIQNEFSLLYDEYHQRVKATVTTAVPLSPEDEVKVLDYLKVLTGKTVVPSYQIDPAMLGGVIARVGDTLIDNSVQQRLKVLRDRLVIGN